MISRHPALDLAAQVLSLAARKPHAALALALAAGELIDQATRYGRPLSPSEQERVADLRHWAARVALEATTDLDRRAAA